MSLTFVAGSAAAVFPGELAHAVDEEIRTRYATAAAGAEPYHSEPVDASGWRQLQERVLQTLDYAPHLTGVDGYQTVFIPAPLPAVEHIPVANLADPLQIASLPELIAELQRFAAAASLPTDPLELMQRAATYLESEDIDADLDVQTYIQLMLSARQAAAHDAPLWIVV